MLVVFASDDDVHLSVPHLFPNPCDLFEDDQSRAVCPWWWYKCPFEDRFRRLRVSAMPEQVVQGALTYGRPNRPCELFGDLVVYARLDIFLLQALLNRAVWQRDVKLSARAGSIGIRAPDPSPRLGLYFLLQDVAKSLGIVLLFLRNFHVEFLGEVLLAWPWGFCQ